MKVFVGQALDGLDRASCNVLTKAWIDRRGTAESRSTKYGARLTQFAIAVDPSEADALILPRPWDGQSAEAELALCEMARALGKPLIVMAVGDLEPVVPHPYAVLFHAGLHASRARGHPAFALPYFFNDRLHRYADDLVVRPHAARPTVGFCGQASRPWLGEVAHTSQRLLARARNIGTASGAVTPAADHVVLRHSVLDRLRRDRRIATNFIVRERYRAGVSRREAADPQHQTNVEFHRNLLESDYIVCVRGTGNFSARFYEALSFGRIPVFVDTDCRLPFDFELDWRELCVWVNSRDVDLVGDRVIEFHEAMSDQDFADRQHALRRLWLDRLEENGFFRHFHRHFSRPGSPSAAIAPP